jgi:hypothetical protein
MRLKRKAEEVADPLLTNVREEPSKPAQRAMKIEGDGIELPPIASTSATLEEATDPSTSEKSQPISKNEPIESSLR